MAAHRAPAWREASALVQKRMVFAVGCPVDILPDVLRLQFRMLDVTEALPDRIQRRVVARAQRMIGRATHAAEGAQFDAGQFRGVLLARLKQVLVDATAAIGAAQDRFAAVENLADVVTVFQERALEFRRLVRHRQAGRRADQLRAVVDQHGEAARGLHVDLQILAFVVLVAVVQVRKLAEHLDAQAREIIDVRRNCRAADALEDEGVGSTLVAESVREQVHGAMENQGLHGADWERR